ncbi:hypothetical protein GCM10007962_08010 [Yeosuana aromativorans]|uniref:Uncharacterized protein n=1 Tax=Yeosuana aromativorans TaxID=288019 RepID=A0A8J3FEA9_9FLAO|nr:hypothetical protein [Yeosuana aromativorans]GGK16053.1 hypothetical protein GCM10007962_08010 [Yeosuana aromativorans]
MSTFEMKTHQIGKTYSHHHFFILNKGLNSGKPLPDPCPNCFVVLTSTKKEKHTLFHLSMMLQIGGFYAYYLKGSVIPFISIDDCRNTLKNAFSRKIEIEKYIKVVCSINQKQLQLTEALSKFEKLKTSYIQICFKTK